MTARDFLDASKRIEDAATEGPWVTAPEVDGAYAVKGAQSVVRRPGGKRIVTVDQTRPHEPLHDENAAFIAHARTALPKMRAALEAVLANLDGNSYEIDGGHRGILTVIDPEVVVRAIESALTEGDDHA